MNDKSERILVHSGLGAPHTGAKLWALLNCVFSPLYSSLKPTDWAFTHAIHLATGKIDEKNNSYFKSHIVKPNGCPDYI